MDSIDPIEPSDPLETDEARDSKAHPRPPAESSRPDWLVGPDDGVEAERERVERAAQTPDDAPTLRKPVPAEDAQAPRGVALRLVERGPEKPKVPDKPVAWTAAASSMPTLRVVSGGAPAPPAPPAARETPGTVDARVSVDARFTPDARFAPVARPAPPPAPAADFDDETSFPDDAGPAAAPVASPRVAAPVARTAPVARAAPPREAWWLVAIDALREDRRVQILAALVVVVSALVAFWPRGEQGVALSEIHKRPQSWNARAVRVSGRVGEVFQVGGGYAFYLHQGRDTLVVFTRSRTPQTRDHLSISGTISTGWLDGLPREALFEEPPK